MRVRRLVLGPLETNCWLVDDGESDELVVIDPADDLEIIVEAIGRAAVAAIVLTHGHFDHLAAARGLTASTGAPLLVHEADARSIQTTEGTGGRLFGFNATAPEPDRTLRDGEEVVVTGTVLEVLHTPGHTPGSICLLGGGNLFSGDTLFSGSIGRTDFAGGDMSAMRRSLARLSSLADNVRVHPGHGPDTSIGRERKINPFFPRA